MKRIHCYVLSLLGVLLALPPLGGAVAGPDEKAQFFAKLQRGMTPEQVRDRVGPPKHISRQILYHRYLEQWIYDAPEAARLTFDCPRGQKPQLLGR